MKHIYLFQKPNKNLIVYCSHSHFAEVINKLREESPEWHFITSMTFNEYRSRLGTSSLPTPTFFVNLSE